MDHYHRSTLESPNRAAHAGVGKSWSQWLRQRCARRRLGSRQFCFAIIFASTAIAKLAHIHANISKIPILDFLLWGITFFTQDTLLLLLTRALLADRWSRTIPRLLAVSITSIFSVVTLFMATLTVNFYIVAGAEIHWRQMKDFLQDSSSAKTLSSGATSAFFVALTILITAWVITPYAHAFVGKFFQYLPGFIKRWLPVRSTQRDYLPVDQAEDGPYTDGDEPEWNPEKEDPLATGTTEEKPKKWWVVMVPFALIMLLRFVRPQHQVYSYLSQTLALSPWLNLKNGGKVDMASLLGSPVYNEQCDSIGEPSPFDWLPEEPLAGFEDWYPGPNGTTLTHYSPERDCSHISNLEEDLLDPVQKAIRENDVQIKHIILIKLETTRKDVFPLVKDSFLWDRIKATHPDNKLPTEAEEGLSKLTENIEYLTGDSAAGHGKRLADKTRGGISASDAFTTSTYTLKSLTGTLCGLWPLAVDFNQEIHSHLYNPCISHVLDAFNSQLKSEKRTQDFTSWPWQSVWMQSVTDSFHDQDVLTPMLGFNKSYTKETIASPTAKYYPPKSNDINYFGLPDTELKPYLRDAFQDAERNQERLFLTHLTGTTHHPWGVPDDFDMKDYLGYSHPSNLNSYLNTVKFIDGWLGDILSVLEETGVANETMIVMAGDHGASLPEDGGITPFDNPHIGCFHVPVVFSHPALPPMKVDVPISTVDVVPTILDLLATSNSLEDKTRKVATDILPYYEGQSLLRPMLNYTEDGHKNWHYTVMNSGGSWLAMRSTTHPYRVAVPLAKEMAWRFTDLATDPHEEAPISAFDWPEFTSAVNATHGEKAVSWLNDAAQAADWWVSKNKRLWHWPEEL